MSREEYIAILEVENAELKKKNQQLKNHLKQRDEVIDEIIAYIQDIIDNPVKYAAKNNLEVIFDIARRCKGENDE